MECRWSTLQYSEESVWSCLAKASEVDTQVCTEHNLIIDPRACIRVRFIPFGSLSTSPFGDESVTQPIASQNVYLCFPRVLRAFLAVFLGATCQCTGGLLANQRRLGHPGETRSKLQQGPRR